MAEYEFWLTDEAGVRLSILKDVTFFSYTRATNGLGTINLGIPFRPFSSKFNPYFKPDWRIEAWRSPAFGIPLRREDVFLIRKPHVYTREDNVQILQFYGRNGIDLLNRRFVIQKAGTSYATKTDNADDIMKAVVREQMLYGSALDKDGVVDNTRAWPQNEFLVQADVAQGPSLTRSFAGKKVYDVLKELKDATFQLNVSDPTTYRRIFFDVVPKDVSGLSTATGSPLGWEFRTYADLFGTDRTTSTEFSQENENIKQPEYSISYLDEMNSFYVNGNGAGASQAIEFVQDADRASVSRWNRVEGMISSSNETSAGGLQSAGYAEIYKNRPKEELPVTFLNTPGSNNTPRSLYGLDWDLGDLLPVSYAGKKFNIEVLTVYISVNDKGKEEITGRNEVNATG